MAERAYTISRNPTESIVTVTWAAFTGADTGEALELTEKRGISDILGDFVGTFNGATFGFETSLDGTTWIDAVDPLGEALAVAADGGSELRGVAQFIRPKLASGTPTSVVPRLQYRKVGR